MSSVNAGSFVSFQDISCFSKRYKYYVIPSEQTQILYNLTGVMKPGLNAIIGPTGCGKTTFLDVLAGRSDPSLTKGLILINGRARPHYFKRISAYVSQDNFAMGSLTVRENLYFSAALRLPFCVGSKERKARVTALLTKLGLNSVADLKVGTELVRGISGGEKKRTNIGIELITDPSVIFLDEPTTGLDTHTAGKLMRLLKRLTADGKTIIASIHQPNWSIYKLFDSLTILCNGRTIYHGPVADSAPLKYFQTLGYKVSTHENPADFFIDLLHQELPSEAKARLETLPEAVESADANGANLLICPKRTKQLQQIFEASADWSSWLIEAKFIFSTWRSLQKTPKQMSRECSSANFHSVSGSEAELSPLVVCSSKSNTSGKDVASLPESDTPSIPRVQSAPLFDDVFVVSGNHGGGGVGKLSSMDSGIGRTEFQTERDQVLPLPRHRQFWILACRGFLNTLRSPNTVAVPFLGVALFSLILGSVYYRLGHSSEAGIQNRMGLFYFISLELAYFNGNAVDVFVRDRAMYRHERASGFYCTSTYFLAKVLCEVLPLKLAPVVVCFPVVYAMAGLRRSVGALFFWEAACLFMGAASSAVVLLCILLLDSVPLGYAVAGIILSFMMTFGGFLLNVVSAWWLGWCRYLSIFWYALSAMSITEMHGAVFCSEGSANVSLSFIPVVHGGGGGYLADANHTIPSDCIIGDEFLQSRGMAFTTSWEVWSNLAGLLVITLVAFFLCYVRLRFTKLY